MPNNYWRDDELDISQAADDLLGVLEAVRPPLKGSRHAQTVESTMTIRVLESLVEGLEKAGLTQVSVEDLKLAIAKERGKQ
jgi:hypothetical protein